MFFGLIFRASGKSKRSILSWRKDRKNVIPTSVRFDDKLSASTLVNNKLGFGFGKQGEKTAARGGRSFVHCTMLFWVLIASGPCAPAGYLISAPIESLPRYGKGSQY
jgi:hypothetical protein